MMSTRGKRKYQCRDCKNTQFVHWVELNRRSGPRCIACGGILEAYSDGAITDRDLGQENLREHSTSRGSVVRANRQDVIGT